MIKNLYQYASIIALNGSDSYSIEIVDWSKKVIAVDGALKTLNDLDINIDYIVGDLDSINQPDLISKYKSKFHHKPDQNTTDFEKAIKLVRELSLTPSLILGINGKEIDHILNNIHVMVKHHEFDGEFFFLDCQNNSPAKIGIIVTKSKLLNCGAGKTISIFPFPSASLTTYGLQYPIYKKTINQCSGILCARNKSVLDEVEIIVHEGLILVTFDIF
jgi:thiamine pyrophosphokinase